MHMPWLLYASMVALLVFVIAAYGTRRRSGVGFFAIAAACCVPAGVVVTMMAIFVVGRGSATAQFAAGSDAAERIWTAWSELWQPLMVMSLGNSIATLVVAIVEAARTRWMACGVSLMATAVSVIAFLTVAANFPTA